VGSEGATEPRLSFAQDLPLTQQAIAFATERHASQRRDSDGAQFIVHPVEVASILGRSGYPDFVVAAAVLHDVLEDTDAESLDLEAQFGPQVSELVALVSDDPSIADAEAQKDDVRDRVRGGSTYAQAVYAADKVSKVRELRMLMAGGLDRDQAETKRRRYRRSLEMLEHKLSDERLVDLLRFELEALESLPPSTGQAGSRASS
jgi:(p)ppGpp synthase/HD superfamily hydrolase